MYLAPVARGAVTQKCEWPSCCSSTPAPRRGRRAWVGLGPSGPRPGWGPEPCGGRGEDPQTLSWGSQEAFPWGCSGAVSPALPQTLLLTRPWGAGRTPSPAPGLQTLPATCPLRCRSSRLQRGAGTACRAGVPLLPHPPQRPQGPAVFQGPCLYPTKPQGSPHRLQAEPRVEVDLAPAPGGRTH